MPDAGLSSGSEKCLNLLQGCFWLHGVNQSTITLPSPAPAGLISRSTFRTEKPLYACAINVFTSATKSTQDKTRQNCTIVLFMTCWIYHQNLRLSGEIMIY